MTKAVQTVDYPKLSSELEAIIAKLQDENTSIDEAIKLYEQANVLIQALSKYLKSAENRLTHLNGSGSGKN